MGKQAEMENNDRILAGEPPVVDEALEQAKQDQHDAAHPDVVWEGGTFIPERHSASGEYETPKTK